MAPDPYYDPLQFWLDEAHARALSCMHGLIPTVHTILPGEKSLMHPL
jgi:uncharacterized lipoprotein YddW (UPF0748 family)